MQEENLLPHQMTVNIDFSQNIKTNVTREETQGGNWSTQGCTLFISVLCFLCDATWNLRPQHLLKGQQVSVEVDDAMQKYGVVVEEWTIGQDSHVSIWHPAMRKMILYDIEKINLRKMITVPHVIVSDYKGHDSVFVKCYLDELLFGPTGWLQSQKEFLGLKERVREVHIDSDGAASHFKNKDSLFSMTDFQVKYCLERLTWTFGAPGHGKGTWDGFGGILKNAATRRIVSESLIVKTAKEVYDLLIRLFCSEIKQEEYANAKRIKVKHWSIVLLPDERVKEYQTIEQGSIQNIESFDGSGTQKIFFFEAMHRGGLGFQLSACWCPACIKGTRSGSFKSIEGCFSREPFEYKIIRCSDAAWIKESKTRVRNLACNLFNTLKIGDVIAFDPMLTSGSRRQCRFDIGQVINISYPYDIEISTWSSLTSTEYVLKKTFQNIHRDTVRYKFIDNPIIQNKIVLTDKIFTTITKNFYNGN